MSAGLVSYQRVCGIDVGSQLLEVLLLGEALDLGFSTGNDPQGFAKIIKFCREHRIELVVLEATGGYQRALAVALAEAQIAVAVVNPARIRHYALAEGLIAKTDKVDARVIALFAIKIAPKATALRSALQEELACLVNRKAQWNKCKVAEENRAQQQANAMIRKGIERHLKFIVREIAKIDARLEELVREDPQLQCKAEAADSVTGVGRASAVALVVTMPELGTLTSKQASALAGLAPFNKDSGKQSGERHIFGGRSQARAVLYMCCLSAICYDQKIKAFYQRLLAAGKCKMKALTACMRKLLVMVNARVREALAAQATCPQ
jgi:transposase